MSECVQVCVCVHIGDMTYIGHVHVPPPLLMCGLAEEEGGERDEAGEGDA